MGNYHQEKVYAWRTLNTILEHSGYELKYELGCLNHQGNVRLLGWIPCQFYHCASSILWLWTFSQRNCCFGKIELQLNVEFCRLMWNYLVELNEWFILSSNSKQYAHSEIFLCVATGTYLYWDDIIPYSYQYTAIRSTAVFQDHTTFGEWNISGVSHSENRFKLYCNFIVHFSLNGTEEWNVKASQA